MKNAIVHTILILVFLYLPGPTQGSAAQAQANQNPITAQVTSLTLARAKQISLENSPTVSAAKARVDQAMEAIAQARSDYLPTVGIYSSWDYTDETASSSGTSQDSYTNTISATQVLFQGFYRKYNTLSAQYSEKMALASEQEVRRTLVWSVAQSYLNAQLAAEDIRIAESDMAFNQEQEKEAIAKERMGTGSYSDVLNFKTKVNSAKSQVIQARQAFKEACYGLAALMGYEDARLPDGMQIQVLDVSQTWDADALDQSGQLNTQLETEISTALDSRPDLQEDWLAVQDADVRVKREKSGYFPTVSLTGAYGFNAVDEFDYLGDDDHMGASVGVEFSFELFSGGSTRASVRSAAAEKQALAKDLEDAKITAAKEIRTGWENVDSARQTLELQAENTKLIEVTRDLVKKEYSVGQASLVRLNEAQNDLVAAEGELADARVSLALALEELDYYTGRNIQ